jgi:hypothetical protein
LSHLSGDLEFERRSKPLIRSQELRKLEGHIRRQEGLSSRLAGRRTTMDVGASRVVSEISEMCEDASKGSGAAGYVVARK